MKFEHLIEINNPTNPMIPLIERDQLWRGLMVRAEDATHFVPGLETCVIIERGVCRLERRLNFSNTAILDCVTWVADDWVCFEVTATDSHAGGRLTITIEEPEEMHLFLRFTYLTTLGEHGDDEDAAYAEFVKSAYYASDVEMVQIIRTLLADTKSQ